MEKVSSVFNRFLSHTSNSVDYLGSNDEVLEMQSFIEGGKLVDFEAPDAYICYKDTILLVEDFQFDGSRTTKKGSMSQREEKRIDLSFDKMMLSETENSFHEVNNAEFNYVSYIQTFKRNFIKHYVQIDKYIFNVKKDLGANFPPKILVCFLVEDVSPIGVSFLHNDLYERVILTRSKEILEVLRSHLKVDWVFTSLSAGKDQRGYFYSQKYSQQYLDNAIPYSSLKQIIMKPHTIGGKVII